MESPNVIKHYLIDYINRDPLAGGMYTKCDTLKHIIDQLIAAKTNDEVLQFLFSYLLLSESIMQTVFCDMHDEHIEAYREVAMSNYMNNTIYNMETTNSLVVQLIMEEVKKKFGTTDLANIDDKQPPDNTTKEDNHNQQPQDI